MKKCPFCKQKISDTERIEILEKKVRKLKTEIDSDYIDWDNADEPGTIEKGG